MINETSCCTLGLELARTALRTQSGIIIEKSSAVAVLDGAAIHDMRVASRRLRMALEVFRPYLPGKLRKKLRRMARSITRDLGTRRELDVMVEMMRVHRDETHGVWQRFMDHAIAIIDTRRAAEADYCRCAAALAVSDGFREVVDGVIVRLESNGVCVLDLARVGILGALAEARVARVAWKNSEDPETLHLVRIALKHLRYACEFYAPLYGDPMAERIAQIKAAQEILGEWNECRLLQDMVLALGGAAEYNLALGAPLVAEAYGKHADELAGQFVPVAKALLGKGARKEFEALVESPVQRCCSEGSRA